MPPVRGQIARPILFAPEKPIPKEREKEEKQGIGLLVTSRKSNNDNQNIVIEKNQVADGFYSH